MAEILLPDLPISAIASATSMISNMLVGFVRIYSDERNQDAGIGGSGTLVKIGNTYGILTAQHVVDDLPTHGEINLVFAKAGETNPHFSRPSILAESIQMIGLPRGPREDEGPDLALIVLSPSDAEWIGASKTFSNLGHRRASILRDERDIANQLWGLSGFPDALTKDSSNQRPDIRIKEFNGKMLVSTIDLCPSIGAFDYVNFTVGYGNDESVPRNLQGFSGGGLWLVELAGDTPSEVRVTDCVLSGVAFYQSKLIDNRRLVRCHWRRSIYEQLFDKVAQC